MTSRVLTSCFESSHIYHGYHCSHPLRYLSNAHSFEIMKEFFDHLYEITYDGEGEVA